MVYRVSQLSLGMSVDAVSLRMTNQQLNRTGGMLHAQALMATFFRGFGTRLRCNGRLSMGKTNPSFFFGLSSPEKEIERSTERLGGRKHVFG